MIPATYTCVYPLQPFLSTRAICEHMLVIRYRLIDVQERDRCRTCTTIYNTWRGIMYSGRALSDSHDTTIIIVLYIKKERKKNNLV